MLEAKLASIKSSTENSLFINARTDVYLRSLTTADKALKTNIQRLNNYARCGVDGGFIPGLDVSSTGSKIVNCVSLPINLMTLDLQIASSQYTGERVARLSVGPSSFLDAYSQLLSTKSQLNFDSMNNFFAK